MGYSKFIQELTVGIEGKVAAYSKKDNCDGCLIYLRNLEQRIFVPADLIDRRRDEAIRVLRAKIREGMGTTPVLILKEEGDELVFETEDAMPVRRRKKIPGALYAEYSRVHKHVRT